jgi:4-hydroxyproline epimerase
MTTARLIDSHTGGEPTRVLVSGGPDLGGGPLADRLARLRGQHDRWRRALMNEPRGNDVLVGALLCAPTDPAATCGVIFFNNVGYLGMCGHGTIGLVETLRHLGRIGPGLHRIETPVGTVSATLHEDRSVTVDNVSSYRLRHHVPVEVPGHGVLHGDIAWGGNWFFLCHDHGLAVAPGNVAALTRLGEAIRAAMTRQGLTGTDGAVVDHIELLADAQDARHHGRSFVLCPGGAYDRSPCGTGTSAKLASLAADGLLPPGQVWHQESVIGSVFSASWQPDPQRAGAILPSIRGRAHVTLDAQVVFDPDDAFAWGLGV